MVKKAIPTSRPWWESDLLIGALSMLILVFVTEFLFAVPSRWIHTPPQAKIDVRPPSDSPAPKACTREYAPVCGADGKTYDNSCLANAAKTIVASEGICATNNAGAMTETRVSASGTENQTGSMERPITSEDYSDATKFHLYSNPKVGYSMSFPKYCWYYGFGAQDGALHTMALGLSEVDIASFATAPVRVWLYKTPPTNPPSTQSVTLANGVLYVANSSDDPKIRKIVQDILASAK